MKPNRVIISSSLMSDSVSMYSLESGDDHDESLPQIIDEETAAIQAVPSGKPHQFLGIHDRRLSRQRQRPRAFSVDDIAIKLILQDQSKWVITAQEMKNERRTQRLVLRLRQQAQRQESASSGYPSAGED